MGRGQLVRSLSPGHCLFSIFLFFFCVVLPFDLTLPRIYSSSPLQPTPTATFTPAGEIRVLGVPFSFSRVPVGSHLDVDILVVNASSPLVPVTILNVTLGNTTDFSVIRPESLPRRLEPGETLVITIRFHPTTEGLRSTVVSIHSTAFFSPTVFTLSGEGTVPGTVTGTPTQGPTLTPTPSPTTGFTQTPTTSPSPSPTPTPSFTSSPTPRRTPTPSKTPSPALTLTHTPTSSPTATHTFTSTPTPTPTPPPTATTVPPVAQLEIVKRLLRPATGVAEQQSLITFEIIISNMGNVELSTVPLEDFFDARFLTFHSATPEPDVILGGMLEWENLTVLEPHGYGSALAPGAKFVVTVTFQTTGCPSEQATTNKAKVMGAMGQVGDQRLVAPPVIALSDVRIACPGVEITKTLLPLECPVIGTGQPASFQITLQNTGNSTLLHLPLTDTYEADCLTYESAQPAPNVLSLSDTIGAVTWNDLTGALPTGFGKPLAPGEMFHVRINLTGGNSTRSKNPPLCRNQSIVRGASDEFGLEAPEVSAGAVISVARPDLFVALAGPNAVIPGTQITYTVTYGNTGLDDVADVRLKFHMPTGATFLRDTLCGQVVDGCYLDTLPAGFVGSLQVIGQVPSQALPGLALPAHVEIESGQAPGDSACTIPDLNPANNLADHFTWVVADFGDAPSPPYPANLSSGGAYHLDFTHEWLGRAVNGEPDARFPDDFDDGVVFRSNAPPDETPWYRYGEPMDMLVTITLSDLDTQRYGLGVNRRLYLRAWIDWNGDGSWDPSSDKIIDWSGGPGMVGADGSFWPRNQKSWTINFRPIAKQVTTDATWMLFRLSYGEGTMPTGPAEFGEVEDYRLVVIP